MTHYFIFYSGGIDHMYYTIAQEALTSMIIMMKKTPRWTARRLFVFIDHAMNEPQKIVVQPNLTVEVTKLLIMIQIMVLFVSIAEINVMTMLGVILMFLPTLIIIVPFTCVTIYAVVKTLIVHYSSKK